MDGEFENIDYDCGEIMWGEWSDYSECNPDCGPGTQYRTRGCQPEGTPTEVCQQYFPEDAVASQDRYCQRAVCLCPAEGLFPETEANVTSIVPCGEGFSGEQTRLCGDGRIWAEEPNRLLCTRIKS